jgi:hypothetical protein
LKKLVVNEPSPSIHPDLNFNSLNNITRETRELIINMNRDCELYYKELSEQWDKLILERKEKLYQDRITQTIPSE